LQDVCLTCSSIDQGLPEYTEIELLELGDGRNGRLLIGLFGRVYDVTSGAKFYGPEGRYKGFAGRDVSYALSSGCMLCLGTQRLNQHNFTEKEIAEGKRWLSFFETHDKYSFVGSLMYESSDDVIERLIG
jgi:membrane-associated progesterone receptor component